MGYAVQYRRSVSLSSREIPQHLFALLCPAPDSARTNAAVPDKDYLPEEADGGAAALALKPAQNA